MFARDRSTDRNGVFEYPLDGLVHCGALVWSIEQKIGVEVPVAGMPVRRNRQSELFSDLLEVLNRLGNTRTRDRDVVGHLVRLQAPERIGKLAPNRPEFSPLLLIFCHQRLERAVRFADAAEGRQLREQSLFHIPVDLRQERRSCALGKVKTMAADTALAASKTERKSTSAVLTLLGKGKSCTVISVATPSVPSEPTNSPTRSYPATPLIVWRPTRRISPLGRTHSSPST